MRIKKERKPKLGIIGKIKVGEKKKNPKTGKQYPTSLDYFRADCKIQRIQDSFDSLYNKCSLLPICFATNDDDFNLDNRYEIRDKGGKLYAYGDGEQFFVSKQEGFLDVSLETILEKYESSENFMGKVAEYLSTQDYMAEWREVLTMRFVLPKIPVLGAWELRTMGARTSIDQIISSYDAIKTINGGSVQMVPFFLSVQKVKSARKLDKARVYPVISLNPLLPEIAKGNIVDTDLIDSASTKFIE